MSKTAATLVCVVTMVTMGGDLQPGCQADRLLTDLGQPQRNPKAPTSHNAAIELLLNHTK